MMTRTLVNTISHQVYTQLVYPEPDAPKEVQKLSRGGSRNDLDGSMS